MMNNENRGILEYSLYGFTWFVRQKSTSHSCLARLRNGTHINTLYAIKNLNHSKRTSN